MNNLSLGAQSTLRPGQPQTLMSDSPLTSAAPYTVVFEDDGETGYFFALDRRKTPNPIVDMLHVYNVSNVEDGGIPSTYRIIWSADGLKAILFINVMSHAVFDFEARRGYCRSNFPPPDPSWTAYDHAWDDNVVNMFRPVKKE